MTTARIARALALLLLVSTALHAQVPQIINYQGRVAVGTTNFNGTGLFKFALIDGGGNPAIQATATATWSGSFITSYTVTNPGSGYTSPPAVTVTGGGGSGATATAVLSAGSVVSITPGSAGLGYTSTPTVTIAPPPATYFTTFWSNDGTSGAGSEPAAAVSLPVTKGLYSVLLGDTALAGMTAIPNSVFATADVRLRVWFNDGTNGSQLLTPDQRIAAVGYALVASTLQPGATITSSTAAPAASVTNSTDNPAALSFSTSFRTWRVGQNKAPDAPAVFDQFFIYDQQANATRLRIDLGGVIYGNGGGLTNIPASALTGTIPASQVATPPPGMAFIPAGPFTMGDSLDGWSNATPTVSTTVSAFYMDVNEVTLSQWQTVQQWATLVGGYTGLAAGSGKGATHPVQTVSWYDCVKWCNARSEREGKTPVYYTDDAQTLVYRTGDVDITNVQVKWTASGYRLPTEAEWEKAARGGLDGKRFPWGDTISQKQANYFGDTGYYFDEGPNGSNAIGSIGGTLPGTSPVGSFAANGYGLNDMIGNVAELCWDRYGTPYAGGSDPRGPATGIERVERGGAWNSPSYRANCAKRFPLPPTSSAYNFYGFRTVLAPGQP